MQAFIHLTEAKDATNMLGPAEAMPLLAVPHQFSRADFCQLPTCRQYLRRYTGARHHCRYCGITVCAAHSQQRVRCIENDRNSVRVCDPCFQRFRHKRDVKKEAAVLQGATNADKAYDRRTEGPHSPIQRRQRGSGPGRLAPVDERSTGHMSGDAKSPDDRGGELRGHGRGYDEDGRSVGGRSFGGQSMGGMTTYSLRPERLATMTVEQLPHRRRVLVTEMAKVVAVYGETVALTLLDQVKKTIKVRYRAPPPPTGAQLPLDAHRMPLAGVASAVLRGAANDDSS